MLIRSVAARLDLGRPVREPVRVPGGLSNELWRLDTDRGTFAVKRMVVNADMPSFVGNVEAAYAVERRAWGAGVAMPEPIADPATGRALARIDGALFRVHRWIEGESGGGSPAEAAGLLAAIQAAGEAPVGAAGSGVGGRSLGRRTRPARAPGRLRTDACPGRRQSPRSRPEEHHAGR